MQETIAFLRTQGASKKEGIVLWRGTVESHMVGRVTAAIVPEQTALSSAFTGHVTVPLEARSRITRQLDQLGEVLLAQVHSHPADAFHSDVDDQHSIVLHKGALSIVVPNFGAVAFEDLSETETYRLIRWPTWQRLSAPERQRLLVLED